VKSGVLWTPDKNSWLRPWTDSHLTLNAKLLPVSHRHRADLQLCSICCCSLTPAVSWVSKHVCQSETPRPSPSHRHRVVLCRLDRGPWARLDSRTHARQSLSQELWPTLPHNTGMKQQSFSHYNMQFALPHVPGYCVSFIPGNMGMENVRDSRAPGNAHPNHNCHCDIHDCFKLYKNLGSPTFQSSMLSLDC